MEKKNWASFLNTKIQAQISLEAIRKAQVWGFAVAAFLALGMGFSAVGQAMGRTYLYETKILFLALTHLVILLFFCLPAFLEKGTRPVSQVLRIRDFTSLIVNGMVLTLMAVILAQLSIQLVQSAKDAGASNFLVFASWVNVLTLIFYVGAAIFFFVSLSFFPQALTKILERSSKGGYVLTGLHVANLLLLGIAYSGAVGIGSQGFFEEFRVAGIFWLALLSLLMFAGRMLEESAVSSLSDLELEVATGRLERHEDILSRYKEAFISRRLSSWVRQISMSAVSKAHEIAAHAHAALGTITQNSPTEFDLRKVEEAYKKADGIYRKLDKDHHRFGLCVSFFDVAEAEREKVEELRDQFSRDLRNSKLELASIRKQIDEKLVAIKNSQPQMIPQVPVEKVPVSK